MPCGWPSRSGTERPARSARVQSVGVTRIVYTGRFPSPSCRNALSSLVGMVRRRRAYLKLEDQFETVLVVPLLARADEAELPHER
jgi:hypothetical protein